MIILSKMKSCGYCICRKLSQLKHIKIWKKIDRYLTEIQSIFQKYADVIICKFKFWVWRPLWCLHELIEDQMRHEIISPTHNLSKYEKILGVSIYSKELQWILYRHVFCPCIVDKDNANPRVLSTLTDAHCVIKRWTSYQNAWKNVPNMMTEKNRRFYVAKR